MRFTVLLVLVLSACSGADVQPRNLVCERVRALDAKATCIPELTDVGDLHTHTARVTTGKDTVICGLNVGQLSMVCGALQGQPAQPAQGAAK